MQHNNKSNTKGIFLAGSIIAGSLLGFGAPKTINANNLFDYNNLGSGSELRSMLLNTSTDRNLEMKCGNKSDSKNDSKAKDASCGANKKADAKKVSNNNMDSKSKDGKCGEGKCGGTKKMSSKDKMQKEESKKQEQK